VADNIGVMRCLRCKNTLERSGKEPYRYICSSCGQHYFLEMQLIPVEASRQTPLLEAGSAERRPRTE
jgi:hypothetical protein